MNKTFRVLLFVMAGVILICGLYSVAHLIMIQYRGSPITATVLHVDTDCDRHNEIQVVFENRTYPVTISRNDCQNRVYRVGQNVTLLKYKEDSTLIWPEAQYQWLPLVFLVALALAYYTNKAKFRKPKKPAPNVETEQLALRSK